MKRVEDTLRDLWIAIYEEKRKPPSNMYERTLLDRLTSKGYIRIQEGSVELTAKGEELGRRIVRLHRLTERLLSDVLDMQEELYEKTACSVEHTITPELEHAICTMLGHPKVCPHGKPIPPGECCIRGEEEVKKAVYPLYDLNPGEEGRVSYILVEKREEMLRLISLGIAPGKRIRLLRKFPSYIIQAGFSQIAIDENVAKQIFVIRASKDINTF